MYTSILKCRYRDSVIQHSRNLLRVMINDNPQSGYVKKSTSSRDCPSCSGVIRGFYFPHARTYYRNLFRKQHLVHPFYHSFKLYSSESDGRNASESKHVPSVQDDSSYEKEKCRSQEIVSDEKEFDKHARLGEQDRQDWLNYEKSSFESRRKESPFLTKRERFKNEFLRRVIPWEKIAISWETFPYYIQKHMKSLLVECVASHLRPKKFASSYGSRLPSSSRRILLQSIPGTELYRERLVKALAHDLQVPLLVLDSATLAPFDFGHGYASEMDDNEESEEECASGSEIDDENGENDPSNEDEWNSENEVKSEDSDDSDEVQVSTMGKKFRPCTIEEFAKRVSEEIENTSTALEPDSMETSKESKRPLRKGDRVKYVGASVHVEVDDRALSSGQRGEVYEVNGDQVAVILDGIVDNQGGSNKDEGTNEQDLKPPVYWIHIQDIVHDVDTQAEEWYIAVEALLEVLPSLQPIIIYFPDSTHWLSRAVPKSNRKEFIRKLEEVLDQLPESVVLICGKNKMETGAKEKGKLTMVLPNLGRLAKVPIPLKQLTEGLRTRKSTKEDDIYKLFTNVFYIHPPKEDELLGTYNKQLEEDRRIIIERNNLIELHNVLEEHELCCSELLQVRADGVVLTKQDAEKVVAWARNHYVVSCDVPCVKGDRLFIPRESLEIALSRFQEQETTNRKPSLSLKSLAKDEYESNFVSAVVTPDEIGVKFDDVGALENVKKSLSELVILPMRRPELFSQGNLLRPCKGILLFGPPGTGKTLLAKAIATEAGANFINVTGSILTSKWFGDAEKLTKALFSFASKLVPVIVFVDEIDGLLGARGGFSEHEATRRMRNEFMAAWDGLRSKENQRIIILGATNRPFDLDDAVIRRLPRRIYVDLPDVDNRVKILRIFLSKERLDPSFIFSKLAEETEGYSGSDLKNLCVAAAYRPVVELLEQEKKEGRTGAVSTLRPLCLNDFIQAKTKVGSSVAYDATSMNELRKWNEQYGEGGSRKKSHFGFGN